MPIYRYRDYPSNVAIRRTCYELGLTTPHFAALVDTSPGTVGDWIRGKSRPPRAICLLARLMRESQVARDTLISFLPPNSKFYAKYGARSTNT